MITAVAVALLQMQAHIQAKIEHVPKFAVQNGRFNFDVWVTIPSGFHAYANPPSDASEIPLAITGKGFKLVKVGYPKGTPEHLFGDAKATAVYEGKIRIPVWVKAPARIGLTRFKVVVDYQLCNAGSCFPPGQMTLPVQVSVVHKG